MSSYSSTMVTSFCGVWLKWIGRSRNADHSVNTTSASTAQRVSFIQAIPTDQIAGNRSTALAS